MFLKCLKHHIWALLHTFERGNDVRVSVAEQSGLRLQMEIDRSTSKKRFNVTVERTWNEMGMSRYEPPLTARPLQEGHETRRVLLLVMAVKIQESRFDASQNIRI
jgi:hypothetical protein